MGNSTKRVRFRINTQSVSKVAGLVSNSVMLAANAYLIGSGFQNHFKAKKQERVTSNLQTTAEIASAVAGLTNVITHTIGINNVKRD